MAQSLHVVLVHVRTRPDSVAAFREATLANAAASLKEPGVVRFHVMQESEDPSRFVLVEVYRGVAGAAAHKDTAHYRAWRDAVAPMMAEPRSSTRYANITDDATW